MVGMPENSPAESLAWKIVVAVTCKFMVAGW
jgi:hypothetical protein